MKGIIYKYESPNGKIYIGQTLNEERRRKEFFDLNKKYCGLKFDNARKKYKPENFKYEILFEKEYDNIDEANNELNDKEIYYIQLYNSISNGYNISEGGCSVRGIMKDEGCKKRMIESLKKYHATHENAFKGHKHTEETKKILSEKALGRQSTFSGKEWDEEHRRKHSEGLKGKFQKEKNPFYGKKHSKETIEEIKRTKKKVNCSNRY